jgi:Na+/proline symporter
MFNQSTWQRVWAAKSVKDMRRGFFGGSFLVFLLMMFFGIMGMIAYGKWVANFTRMSYLVFKASNKLSIFVNTANDPAAYDSFEKYACKQW